jgi:hypothetical protein
VWIWGVFDRGCLVLVRASILQPLPETRFASDGSALLMEESGGQGRLTQPAECPMESTKSSREK